MQPPEVRTAPSSHGAPPPVPLSSFVGRQQELTQLHALLRGERLVTITGPGGGGKTRLALAVSAGLTGQVAWVDLARVSDAGRLTIVVAKALGATAADGVDPAESIRRAVAGRHLLVLLDNCEHLLPAVAEVTTMLLTRCPDLRVLATSRAPLGLSGERVWPIAGLAVPPPGCPAAQLPRHPAAALFLDRAAAAGGSVEPLDDDTATSVVAICQRLDGMPLALELAAARSPTLSAAEILERLDQSLDLLGPARSEPVDRHATLRAALDWSWRLLDDPHRVVLTTVAQFAPTFTVADVEGVLGDRSPDPVLDLVGDLVAHSWIKVVTGAHGARALRLLEVVRQYIGERAAADPALAAAARRARAEHAAHYLRAIERLAAALRTGQRDDQPAQLAEFDRIADNVRRAMHTADDGRDPVLLARLVAACWWPWWLRADFREGMSWADTALSALGSRPAGPDPVRAELHHGRGWLARHLDRLDAAAADLATAAAAYPPQRLSERSVVAHRLAAVALDRSRPQDCPPLLEQSLDLAERAQDPWAGAAALYWAGVVAAAAGEHATARTRLRTALRRFVDSGDGWAAGRAEGMLAGVLVHTGELAAAKRALAGARRRSEAVGDRWGLAQWQLQEARLHRSAGRPDEARHAADDATTAFTALGDGRRAEEAEALRAECGTTQCHAAAPALSERELEVLALVARGARDADVARDLVLSVRTVGGHLSAVYRKLGVTSRTAAVRRARELGLVDE